MTKKAQDCLRLAKLMHGKNHMDHYLSSFLSRFELFDHNPDMMNIYKDYITKNYNIDDFNKQISQIYGKHYTHDEIKKMLVFYDSNLGKKMLRIAVPMALEIVKKTANWIESETQKHMENIKGITIDFLNDKMDKIVAKYQHDFAQDYAKSKGWTTDLNALSDEQIQEICEQPEWNRSPVDIVMQVTRGQS